MPRPTDRDRILRALSKAGGSLTNDQVRTALGLQPARYDAVKAQLLQEELIEKQRTRGGGIRLTKKGAQEVTSNDEDDQLPEKVAASAKAIAIDAVVMGNDADRIILLELLEEIRAKKSLPKLDSFRSHRNDGSERAFDIVAQRIAVCDELLRKKVLGLRLDRCYLTAAALQVCDTVEARRVLALCDSVVNVLKAHYPQRTAWTSIELSREVGSTEELTAHALTVLQQAPGIVVDNTKRPDSGFVGGISVDEQVFSVRPLFEGRGLAAQQAQTTSASSEPKSSHPDDQATATPEVSKSTREESNVPTSTERTRWVSVAAAVVVMFTASVVTYWACVPQSARSCPDSVGQQAVPYRDGTICVTHAFAEFLACLEMNKLEEIAKGAKTTIGGEGTVKKGQAEATVKAEDSAVGDVKMKYASGSDGKIVATCICKYEGNCEPRSNSGDAAAPIQTSAPQSDLGRDGGTSNPASFDCSNARLPDFAPGAVQFDVGEFGKLDAATFELRRLKNLLTTERNAQLWQNAAKVLERNSRDGTTWVVAMVNVHPNKEGPFCAWLKCLGWKQCHQPPSP